MGLMKKLSEMNLKNRAKMILTCSQGFSFVLLHNEISSMERDTTKSTQSLLPDVIPAVRKGSKSSRQNLQERKKFTGLGFVCDLLPRLH